MARHASGTGIALLALCLGLSAFNPPPTGVSIRSPKAASAGFADVHPSLLVTNPRVLLGLETDRFSLGDVLGVRADDLRREDYAEESAEVLAHSPVYADLVAALRRDISTLRATTRDVGVGPHYRHRLFDVRWLISPRVHYELVGVVNRLDFDLLRSPGCGQTRFVYRMAYRPPQRPQTRLPMTINVIYDNHERRCADLARQWLAVEDSNDVLSGLREGPIAGMDVAAVNRIEVDVQSLRQNAADRNMDDHAEYVLRGFSVVRGHLVEDTLRNTPDVEMDAERKERLRQWVTANVDAIDRGAIEVPAEFLATRSISLTPRGLSRGGNRPFKKLFPEENEAFGDVSFAETRLATSPALLVRRLDEATCAGCHQSRTIAGFHLLGEDRIDTAVGGLTLGISEHLRQILEWRYRFLKATAAGGPSEPVPFAEHVDERGGYGAHCTTSSAETASDLPTWTCAAGFVCAPSPVEGDPIGICVHPGPKEDGDPCQRVQLDSRDGANGDHVSPYPVEPCGDDSAEEKHTKCDRNKRGFIGGMCSTLCAAEGERSDESVCMRLPHFGFEKECFKEHAVIEQCLAEPGRTTLEQVRTCSRTQACRDDFVCARSPNMPADEGACVPPYFLFQARVDGPPIDR